MISTLSQFKVFFAGATISLGGPAVSNQAVAEGPDDEPEIEELLSRGLKDRKSDDRQMINQRSHHHQDLTL